MDETSKQCRRCGEVKPCEEFGRDKQRKDGLNRLCRPCANEVLLAWHRRPENLHKQAEYNQRSRAANPERTRLNRLRDRCSQFGITVEQYEGMHARQHGLCGVCGKTEAENGRAFAIDHDHTCCPSSEYACGVCVRGLLCLQCNTLVGWIEHPQRELVEVYLQQNRLVR